MKKTMLAAVSVLALLCGVKQEAQALYDGTPSTGSFTIATNASLAAASATGSLTIVDTTTIKGTMVTIGAYQFIAGRDFQPGATLTTAATNLAAAINASPAPVTAVGNSAVVNLTAADVGTLYNAVSLASSNSNEVSTSAATMTGGLGNAYVSVNAVTLVQGRDWFKQDTSSNTAINLASAINRNVVLAPQVNAVWLGGSSAAVYLRAVVSPVAYPLATSGSVITKSGATMTGGSAGTISNVPCFLGTVNSLPTANYPAGCMLYLSTDATHLYISTQAVTGAAAAAANSWLAK